MRFINLSEGGTGKSTYETILKLGCGPNFVLNRVELFETMIKDQGATFWFRFWLTFCFNPGSDDLCAIQRQWPEMSAYVNRGIHKLFLSGSHQDTCQYCLDIIKLLSIPSPISKPSHVLVKKAIHKKKQRNVAVKEVLQELLIKCLEMAYSCALCTIFYEWLGSCEYDKTNNAAYWVVPTQYLDPNFQPGPLEIFMVNEWEDKLAALLGITYVQAPWLRRLMKERAERLCEVKKKLELDCKLFSLDTVTQVAVLLSIRRNEHRKAIQKCDEISNGNSLDVPSSVEIKVENKVENKRSQIKPKVSKDQKKKSPTISGSVKVNHRACAFCGTEINKKKFSKCMRCSNENWLDQRYYCSNTCKVEHWFQEHYKEHCEFTKQRIQRYKTAASLATTLRESRT